MRIGWGELAEIVPRYPGRQLDDEIPGYSISLSIIIWYSEAGSVSYRILGSACASLAERRCKEFLGYRYVLHPTNKHYFSSCQERSFLGDMTDTLPTVEVSSCHQRCIDNGHLHH